MKKCIAILLVIFWLMMVWNKVKAGNDVRKMKDHRDGQTYRVERMPDGRLWMAENLRFGNCRELSVEEYAAGSARIVNGVMQTKSKLPLWGVCLYRSVGKAGIFLYNWQAAMQAETAVSDSTQIDPAWQKEWQGICPEGWHLPSAEEFRNLYRLMGAEIHRWLGIPDDYVYANGQSNYGGYGGFWTSTPMDAKKSYSFHFNHVYIDPAYGFDKAWGKAVRCVSNEQNEK